jgi:hypothetical protein
VKNVQGIPSELDVILYEFKDADSKVQFIFPFLQL